MHNKTPQKKRISIKKATSIISNSSNVKFKDILLYNSADTSFDSTSKVNAVVFSSGEVTCKFFNL